MYCYRYLNPECRSTKSTLLNIRNRLSLIINGAIGDIRTNHWITLFKRQIYHSCNISESPGLFSESVWCILLGWRCRISPSKRSCNIDRETVSSNLCFHQAIDSDNSILVILTIWKLYSTIYLNRLFPFERRYKLS